MSSLSITQLTTVLGAYSRENKADLVARILLDNDLESKYEVMDDVTDEVPLPSLELTDIVKPADPTTFAPTANALAFNARVLKARAMKVDLQIIPQVLEKTWLGMARKKGSDNFDMPFEEFIFNYIIEKAKSSIRLKAEFKGVYNAAGTATADTFNGWNKLIVDEIALGNITPVVTGAITSATAVSKIEQTYDALDEAYKALETQMFVSPTIYDWYTRDYRATYGPNNNYAGMDGAIKIDGTNCTLKREPGLAGSQRLICSVKENMVYGVDSMSDYSNIDVQKFDRTVKILMDFKAGVNFKITGSAIAVNDQA